MAFFVALGTAVVAIPLIIKLSPALGLVDRPGDDPLKVHRRPIARSGGIGVGVALAVAMFVSRLAPAPLLVGGGGALLLGLFDDRWGLSPKIRFVLESALAFVVATLSVGADSWLRFGLAGLVFLVAINAANMFDGLDGLLASTGALTALGLGALASASGQTAMLALAGALVGFWLHNRPPARIFLGDGGAYLVGAVLGVALIELSPRSSLFMGGLLTFGMIGFDFLLTLVRRWRTRRPFFVGDRSHIYDQLVDSGLSIWRVLMFIVGAHAILVTTGVTMAQLRPAGTASAFAVVCSVLLIVLWMLSRGSALKSPG